MRRQLLAVLVAGVLLAGGCSLIDGGAEGDTPADTATTATEGSRTPGGDAGEDSDLVAVSLPSPAPVATFAEPTFDRLAGDDRIATAIAVSRRRDSAPAAVLARADEFADALAAAPLAAHLGAPLLLTPSDALPAAVAAELDRLGVADVVVLGGPQAIAADVVDDVEASGVAVERIAGDDRYETAAGVASRVPPSGRVYVVTGRDFPDALAAGAAAARLPAPILLVADDLGEAAADVLAVHRPAEAVVVGGPAAVDAAVEEDLAADGRTVERVAGDDRYGTAAAVHRHVVEDFGGPAGLWLASATGFADALSAGPAAAAAGATLLLAHPTDLALADATVDVVGDVGGSVTIVGGPAAVPGQAPRQIRAAMAGNLLPDGSTELFPAHRMVAYYGNAQHSVLGVLGETTPDEAAETITDIAADYEDGERPVMPAFELIVTIASAGPGDDGQYSDVGPLSDVREYLDVAREHGVYLFLDFQPGRNEFLDQVRLFEEFLREPDVGVALDPEWRMTDAQRPGQVIGSVDAAEVNEVADYLADIVREEDLPQKLLVVHQFRHSMITDRDDLRTPPELAVTIHVDGFGNQGQKLDTWNALASSDSPWFHGFKLFYDEDTDLFSPDEVLSLEDPSVDLVTYQ